MLIKDKDGDILRAEIAPGFMTIVTTYATEDDDTAGRAAEFPGATLETWEWEIVEASDEERAAMLDHGILPAEHTLWVEDANGERHAAHIDFEPTLNWSRFGCASSRAIKDGLEFTGCRLVAASPADVKLLRRFGFYAVEGLDEIEEQLKREQQRAA